MKFAVGYQMAEGGEEPFSEMISRYRDSIEEVYFPWLHVATGRSPLQAGRGRTDEEIEATLLSDLRALKAMGIRLDLLFNGNCYGGKAMSVELRDEVLAILQRLQDEIGGVEIITTTSPFIAETVKKSHPEIEVRASVNMGLGTVKSMEYLSELFDSFYVQREFNRDLSKVSELKKWCDAKGKKLLMLANSGCLNYCTGHIFHDNLVAHEAEVCKTENDPDFMPYTCWRYLRNPEHWPVILQNSWIRPEDVHHYEGLISTMKLATRMHSRPEMVVQAYTSGHFYGNLPDLCEPGFGPAIYPYALVNELIPEDFFAHVSACEKNCHECGYCRGVFEKAAVMME